MLERIISGVIALVGVVSAIVWGGELAVEILVGLVVLIGLDEWARMSSKPHYRVTMPVLLLVGGGLYSAMMWGTPVSAIAMLAVAGLAMFCTGLYAIPDTSGGATTAQSMMTGLVYIPGLLVFVPWTRELGMDWLFLMLIVTWCGDTGAYFAGRSFGKNKLFERISPKKTWEGAIGGVLLSVVGALIVRSVDGQVQPGGLADVAMHHVVILAVLINVAGVTGDLVESMFKRTYGVKDSGRIMPGHGGVLDRMDSIIFTAPITWIYAVSFVLN